MGDDDISSQVRQFIASHIASVLRLEILLLLKTNPTQMWTPESIAKELRIDARAAAEQLSFLHQGGLFDSRPQGYCYSPADPALDAAVTALAQAYLVRRVTVIGLIYGRSTESIRAFSDAFKIRRDPPNA